MRALPMLLNSKIAFFVSSRSQSITFHDIYNFRPLRVSANAHKAATTQAKCQSTAHEGTHEQA